LATLRWTEQALADLEAACLYIARDAPMVARAFAVRVFESTDRLESFPLSGRVVPELGRDDLREVIVQSYRVIYQVELDQVVVLTVHHGARLLVPLNDG
jgi:addiction module RelE/StbE family toxin